jgi:hypothetical protein
MRVRHLFVGGVVGVGALVTLTAQGSTKSPGPTLAARELLRNVAALSDKEWTAIERGEALAKVLDSDSREIAVVGAIRIAAPSERLAARARDVAALERSAIVLQAGVSAGCHWPLTLRRSASKSSLALEGCRPQDCHVRLSAADIARFHREVDWRAQDWRDRSVSIWREMLAEYAAAYAREGRRALPVRQQARAVERRVRALHPGRQSQVRGLASPDSSHLREFGPGTAGTAEVLYWTKEDFGLRPVVRISHQTIYKTPTEPPAVLIATNQLYADHYLDAALTVTLAIDRSPTAPGDGFYLVAVSYARTRSLSGLFRAFVRSTVQSRSLDAMRKILTATKSALEKPS